MAGGRSRIGVTIAFEAGARSDNTFTTEPSELTETSAALAEIAGSASMVGDP